MKSRRESTKENKQQNDIEAAVEEFGRQAESPKFQTILPSSTKSVVSHKYRRFTFSLTEEISEKIDELALTTARTSRSDIVKTGILSLTRLSKEDLKNLLEESKST